MKWRDPRIASAPDPWKEHGIGDAGMKSIAAELGIGVTTIENWRHGYRRMSVVQCAQVAEVSGMPVESLFWHHLARVLAYEARRDARRAP